MSKKNGDNSDFMSRRQDEQLEQLEERLTALYANAANELESKYTDYMAGFEKDDKAKRELVEQGKISEDEYTAWRKNTMLKSNQYTKAVESMTNTLVETDAAAMAIVNNQLPQTVAQSYDFVQALGYEAAKESGLTAGTFQIYNAETVQALIKDNPDMLPKPAVDIPEDKRWNKDRINRELTQGIVQGESIQDIATRLQQVTNMDRNAAIRNARTAMTGAENMGRYQSAEDLREQGIPVEEVWSATNDDRTRESHRLLDGTTRDESGYFGVGIIDTPLRFAGDPLGPPEEVYNCRCRTGIVLQGIDHSKDQDLYEEFMKQFEDGKDVLDGKEPDPEAESQHQEPEQKSIDEIQPELATSESEDLTAAEDIQTTEELSSETTEEQEHRGHIEEKYINNNGTLTKDGAEAMANELGVTVKEAQKLAAAVNQYSSSDYRYIRLASNGQASEIKKINSSVNAREMTKVANDLETFIDKSPNWEGGQVYRGMVFFDQGPVDTLINKATEGEQIDLMGISSWTSNASVAEDYASSYSSDAKGVIFVSNNDTLDCGTSIKHLSESTREDEILVSKTAEFHPTGMEEKDGIIYIYGDLEKEKK